MGALANISQRFYSFTSAITPTQRHFFGSGHGKGPSDACSGVVKASVTRTARGGRIIANVNDLLKYGEEKLTRNREKFYRTFHLVMSEEVKRSISINSPKTVKGTKKLHSVKSVSPGVICTRELTCLCTSCLETEVEKQCENIDNVKQWTRVELQANEAKSKSKTQKRKKDQNVETKIQGKKAKVQIDVTKTRKDKAEKDETKLSS